MSRRHRTPDPAPPVAVCCGRCDRLLARFPIGADGPVIWVGLPPSSISSVAEQLAATLAANEGLTSSDRESMTEILKMARAGRVSPRLYTYLPDGDLDPGSSGSVAVTWGPAGERKWHFRCRRCGRRNQIRGDRLREMLEACGAGGKLDL